MLFFYDVMGLALGVLAMLMFRLGASVGADEQEFRAASRSLCAIFLLTAFSMFAAGFEPELDRGEFQMMNPLMLLFFYLTAQGFIHTLLILYKSDYAEGKYLKKSIPILLLYGVYLALYLIWGDQPVYSAQKFLIRLPHEPMLILRLVLFAATLFSVMRGVRLCYAACRDWNSRMVRSFAEEDFLRSIVVTRFMWSAQVLALWALLTCFYTTPVLEVVSCSLMVAVFAFQFVEFRNFIRRHTLQPKAAAATFVENDPGVGPRESEVERRLRNWVSRTDKPFTRSSLTIADVVREIGIPKNRFSAYINDKHANFRSWMNDLRIEEAKRLLRERKDLSISAIAECTGFCDLPAFSRTFKKTTGLSPKSFRHENLEGSEK